MKKLIYLFIIAMLVSGCATPTSVNLYNDKINYKPTNPKEVTVFHKVPQDRQFIEIGEITVSGVYDWKTVEKQLKKKTADLGGDAVYILKEEKKQEGALVGYYGAMDTQLIVTGVVIKYKEIAK